MLDSIKLKIKAAAIKRQQQKSVNQEATKMPDPEPPEGLVLGERELVDGGGTAEAFPGIEPVTLDLSRNAEPKGPVIYRADRPNFADLAASGIGRRIGPPKPAPLPDDKKPVTLRMHHGTPGHQPIVLSEENPHPIPTYIIEQTPKPEPVKDKDGKEPVHYKGDAGHPLDVKSVSTGLKLRPGLPAKPHTGLKLPIEEKMR